MVGEHFQQLATQKSNRHEQVNIVQSTAKRIELNMFPGRRRRRDGDDYDEKDEPPRMATDDDDDDDDYDDDDDDDNDER